MGFKALTLKTTMTTLPRQRHSQNTAEIAKLGAAWRYKVLFDQHFVYLSILICCLCVKAYTDMFNTSELVAHFKTWQQLNKVQYC